MHLCIGGINAWDIFYQSTIRRCIEDAKKVHFGKKIEYRFIVCVHFIYSVYVYRLSSYHRTDSA